MPVEFLNDSTVLDLRSDVAGKIGVRGWGNTIRVGRNVTLDASIWIKGHGALVEIGDDCQIGGVIRIPRGEGATIRIGRGTTIQAAGLSMHETGTLSIGEDCMFSTDIQMDVSDMHPIYDRQSGERLNPARDILIGDHVWLGARVLVTKGARIGDGAVVGAGSVVTGTLPAHVVAAGVPARVLRENVEWRRDFPEGQ